MRNLGRGALPCFRGPPPRRPPTQGALPSGAGGSSPTHGRQQTGPGRVGLRSAGFRGRQATGFEAKGILKDHGSLSRSLVTFCRRRKSLALRRNRRRTLRDTPPDAGRHHAAPFGGHRGRSPLYRNWVAGGFRKRVKVSGPSTRRLPIKHRKPLGPSGLQAGRCSHLKNVYQGSTKVTFAARKGGFFAGLGHFQNL